MQVNEPVTLAGAQTAPILSLGDLGLTLFMLAVVLAVIVGLAYLVKRFHLGLGLTTQRQQAVQVLSTTMVSAKERVVVLKAGESVLLLGVTPHNISLIKELPPTFEQATQANNHKK